MKMMKLILIQEELELMEWILITTIGTLGHNRSGISTVPYCVYCGD
jgi:hypothetical protein